MIYGPFDKGFRVIEHGRGRRAVDVVRISLNLLWTTAK